MKLGTFAIAASTLALGLASFTTPGQAQGPLWDRVNVNLPYSVTIGDKTLQPGEYVIQQNRDMGGGGRVLLIYSNNGMKFETSAMTIPTLDNNTPEDTKVVLHHLGPDYYFDKIWIQGKNYGYEFPLPNSVKARQKEALAAVTVPAQYQTVPAETNSAATTTATASAAPATEPPVTTAQATTPAATMAPVTPDTTADRETPAPAMPSTSAGWLMMLLGGGTLSGAGMMLRRKR